MPVPVPNPSRDDWDENDWERFFQRSDVRSAKYQELLETLLDHPQRDDLIAREMGWEEQRRKKQCQHEDCPECEERSDCESYEMLRLMEEASRMEGEADAGELAAGFEEIERIEAFRVADAFGMHLHKLMGQQVPDWANDEEAALAVFNAHMAAAKIAGGHGIGYDRDSLCGNIANCKRGLRSLDECIETLEAMSAEGRLAADVARKVVGEARQVRACVQNWIDTLRSRVWWR